MIRRPRIRPLADFIQACLTPSLAAQGFAASDILLAWPDIVGARLAECCQPVKLEWPRRSRWRESGARPEPATLVIRVESAYAIELQHLAPLVLERVNTHYGWRCVGRLVLKQGPVRRGAAKPAAEASLSDEERRRIDAATEAVGDDGLRAALDRLGEAVVASQGAPARRTKA